jgi:HK97 family phage prohead protease
MDRILITKKAPDSHQSLELKFRPASDEEIRKALGITDLAALPDGFVAGWASTPDLDHYRHVLEPGAFDASISRKGLTGPKGIKFLIQHDANRPAGVIKKLETRNGSLWMEAEMDLEISYVKDYYRAAKTIGGLNFSVGFYLEDYSFKQQDDGVEFLHITKAELEEVSAVTFPGNSEATMTFIKDRQEPVDINESYETLAALEKALVASGVVKSRNMASRITLAVKKNIALFTTAETPSTSPLVAKERLDTLSTILGELRSALEAK